MTQGDLNLLRAKIKALMESAFIVQPSDVEDSFPKLISSVANPAAPFLLMPAEFTQARQAVYGDSADDTCPLLWVHFTDLREHLLAMRYTVKTDDQQWISKGEVNQYGGQWCGGYIDTMTPSAYWEACKQCVEGYSPSASVAGQAPQYYTAGFHANAYCFGNHIFQALLNARYSYLQVANIPALPNKARFYARAEVPPEPGGPPSIDSVCLRTVTFANPSNIGGLKEHCWVQFGREQSSDGQTVLTSDKLGTTEICSDCWCPQPPSLWQVRTTSGFIVDGAAVVLEWTDLLNEPLRRPTDDDTEEDGLVDAGCECTKCEPEADAGWKKLTADPTIRFALGLSSGRITGGVRIKAYITERLLLGVPRQLQKPDPLLDVVLVRVLVAFDPGSNLGLLLAPR